MACFVGKFVVFTSGSNLLVLDVPTGVTTRHQVHTQEIAMLKACDRSFVTGGKDGKLILWTLPHFQSIDVGAPVRMLALSPHKCYFVRGSIVHINTLDLATSAVDSEVLLKGKIDGAIDLAVLPLESGLAVLQRNQCVLYRFDAKDVTVATHDVPLTCICVSPADNSLVFGDALGQIMRLCLETGVKSRHHWHAHAVKALAVTSDGAMLLSGGEEGVIVLWQAEINKKTFFPRLEAPILSIGVSAENEMYAVRLLDNSLKVFQASDYTKLAHFQGLTDPSRLIPNTGVCMAAYGQDDICLNGSPGFLQIYSLSEEKIIKRLDCSKRNQVSRSQTEYPNPVQVLSIAVVGNGKKIATVERADSPHFKISYLKFWEEDLILNTIVLNPHGNDPLKVVSVNSGFVSLGKNGSFIEWTEGQTQWTGGKEFTYRNLSASDACEYLGTLCIAFQAVLVHFQLDFAPGKVAFESNLQTFKGIAAVDRFLIGVTNAVRLIDRLCTYTKT